MNSPFSWDFFVFSDATPTRKWNQPVTETFMDPTPYSRLHGHHIFSIKLHNFRLIWQHGETVKREDSSYLSQFCKWTFLPNTKSYKEINTQLKGRGIWYGCVEEYGDKDIIRQLFVYNPWKTHLWSINYDPCVSPTTNQGRELFVFYTSTTIRLIVSQEVTVSKDTQLRESRCNIARCRTDVSFIKKCH